MRRDFFSRGAGGALVLLSVLALSGEAGAAPACGWATKDSSQTRNILFIDAAATYWNATVAIPEGGHIEVRGRFPRARYMSLVVYDSRWRAVDHLTDTEIEPDPGATNPFLPGAARASEARGYTLRILDGRAPAGARPANTLYTESADGSRSIEGAKGIPITLRIYAPDLDTDESGGMGLPEIAVVLASGERIVHPSCLDPNARRIKGLAHLPNEAMLKKFAGTDPPVWTRFFPDGLGENVDNSYVDTAYAPALGEVLVLRGRAPTHPTTLRGDPAMAEGELRYWSMCSYFLSTAVHTCLIDETVPRDAEGNYTIVVSRPEKRPKNAVPECGIAWLEAVGEGNTVLVYRHMIPEPSFAQAIQRVPQQGQEAEIMGDYYPRGTYYPTVAEFEQLGCNP